MDEHRHRQAERALWASVGVDPSERSLALERTATSIRIQEVGDGPPVVFVHGASNGGASWASLVAKLGGLRCILVDRPGCGLSPPLATRAADMATLDAFADNFIVDVVDALGLAAAHVVGTSFGGYFALRTAAAHPNRVDRLATLGWSFGAPAAATPLVMRIAMQPVLGRLALRIPMTERMARAMLRQIGLRRAIDTGRFGPVEMAWFLSLLRDTDTMRNEIAAAPRIVTLRGFNEATRLAPSLLAKVTCPTYVLWGEEDPMGGAEIARPFAAHLPNAELELLPRAGHAPWIDEPDHVADRLRSFLGGSDTARGI